MTAERDPIAVKDPCRVTSPPSPGASDLAGLGSHLPSPPPEIRVQHYEADAHQNNAAASCLNASLGYGSAVGWGDLARSTAGQLSNVNRSEEPKISARLRSDSLSPSREGQRRGAPAVDESSFDNTLDILSDNDSFRLPIRRGSFRPVDAPIEKEVHYYGSDIDSTAVYPGDLIEDSDKDDDHPYTDYLMPIMQSPSRSRASSVISDGGEQNHLALKEPSDPQPDPLRTTSSRLPRARSQRNALQMQIYGAMEESRSDDASLPGHRFLPKDRLCQVINPITVFDELVKCLPDTKDQIQKYADTICDVTPSYEGGRWKQKSFRLVFVILVLVERSKHILSFLDENVSDLDLPLVPVKEYGIVLGMQRRTSTTDRIPHDLLGCFDEDGWSPSSMEQFDRYQWFMLAPFFSDGKCGQINHYPLHDQHILPFLSRGRAEDDDEEGQGGYARVMMVTLHHAHHELTQKTNRNCNFAVKQLFSNDRESFEKEREILKKFSGANSHRHIVSLLATYSYRNKYHFIFDRAQHDLGRFWEHFKQPPELAHGDVVWIADQCLGITEGLSRIHRHRTFKKWTQSMPGNGTQNKTEGQPDVKVEVQAEDTPRKSKVTFVDGAVQPAYHSPSATEDCGPMVPDCASTLGKELLNRCEIKYGRHGDINPQNILWFRDETEESDLMPGVMRGTLKIADFGTAEMNSFWSKSGKRDVANTLTYRPPECDSVDKTIRQSFDIWCLGCVFLEFIAWSMGGASLVRSFAEKRMSRDPAYGNDRTDTYFTLVFNHNEYDLQAKIKDSVFEFVKFLHTHPHCTEFFHNLLNIVIYDMLLVKSEERLNCRQICTKLRRLRDHCQSDEYAVGSSPWRNGDHLSPQHLLRPIAIRLTKDALDQVVRNLPMVRSGG